MNRKMAFMFRVSIVSLFSRAIFTLLIAGCFLFIPHAIFGQTEKLDIFEYTPPKGWTRTPKDGFTVYSDSNKSTGAFCVLTVYASTSSFGSPQKDFAAQWSELIVKQFKADANPKTENQTEDGWTTVAGGAQIESDGIKSYVIMTILSGYGRTVTTYAILNDQSYLEQIGAVLTSIKMDKAKALASAKPLATPASSAVSDKSSAYVDFDPFPDKPYVQPQKPLIGRLRKTITMADLAGVWEIGGASVTSYYSSGNYSSTDVSFFGEKYTIRADGTFDSKFQGRASNTTIRESDSGTIVLSGGFLTFKFNHKPAMRYQFVAYMDDPKGGTVLSLIYIGENTPLNGEALQANCSHANGFVTCLNGEEFMRLP